MVEKHTMQLWCGTKSKHTPTWAPTADVSSAVNRVTSRTSVAANLHAATAQVITRQATRSAMWWGARKSRDHSVVIRWRSAPTAKEITLGSATDV